MKKRRKCVFWAMIIGVLIMETAIMQAATWQKTSYKIPATEKLRGYGKVATENLTYTADSGKKVWVTRFSCTNKKNATTLISKFFADLDNSPDIKDIQIKAGKATVPAKQTASASVFTGYVQGAICTIISTVSKEMLSDFLNDCPIYSNGSEIPKDYPNYLDRFDRYGWGCYGMGGFNNFHNWMEKADGKKTPKDPTEDVEFMIKNKFRFELWLDPAHMDNSDGITKNTETEWMIKMLTDANMPFSCRVYGAAGGADWPSRRFGEYIEEPAKWMMCGWLRPWLGQKASPHLTWFDKDVHRYMAVKTMDMMKPYADNPLNMGWMHPHGELQHQNWYDRHDDYSPRAQKHWQNYLQKKGFSLEQVSKMYSKEKQPFTSWEQVSIPEFATFAGLNEMIVDLGGTWFYRKGRVSTDKKDTNYPGLKEEWFKQPLDSKDWTMIKNVPGSDRMYEATGGKTTHNYSTTWFRRNFDMSGKQLKNEHIYFYWFPITKNNIHSGEFKRYNKVFINGKKAGEIGTWGAIDVRKLLKPGNNEICLQLFGPVWQGRAFLSTEKPAVYPYLGKEKNRLFLTWQDWHIDTKYESWEEILDAMRQVDPNRPIKFMAPIKFRADRWLKLAHDWGGWGHFTGEGQWFFPWYKRYGFLYGLPGTSELAGPADNIDKMFDGFRRTFLAGLNGHEPVFLAQTYTRPPATRKWWEDHNPVLKRMGKYDIWGPQVLLYRSTHGTIRLFAPKPYPTLGKQTREINNGWDWDIGRGTLQTLGHSYLYLDDQGLVDGKMNNFPLMIDAGNETMPEKSIKALEEWVKAGGTYVAFPFSGRNTELEPDSWKITQLTGCKVGKLREIAKGTVTVGKDQKVFKKLAGKTFPDHGKSLDYIGNNHNLYSVELEPGDNCEVLAVYENGKPAIVRRKLGKGSVITLGSAFWRNSQDRSGLWWPEKIETDFFSDLFNGLKFNQAICTTNDRLVWAQPYRSNNGLDEVTCLVSWHDDKDVDVEVKLRLPKKPAKLFSYGIDGQKELKFTWTPSGSSGQTKGVATTTVNMPAREVKILNTPVYAPESAIAHWWQYQQKMWHKLKEPTIDFTPYRKGKWADPTLDLRKGGAEITLTDPKSGKAKWQKSPVSILNFWGAQPNKPVWLRKKFTVPPEWKDQGGKIFLVSAAWSGRQYEGSAKLSLNGKVLHDFVNPNNFRQGDYDVTKLLTDGKNEVMIEFKGDQKYLGIKGLLYLYHWVPPYKRISLSGEWDSEDKDDKPIKIKVPGTGLGWGLTRKVFIPEEWKGKYQIRLYMDGNKNSTYGAYINDRMARRHHHLFNTVCDLDITRFLDFGKENTIDLLHWNGQPNRDKKRPLKWDLKKVELHLYKKK